MEAYVNRFSVKQLSKYGNEFFNLKKNNIQIVYFSTVVFSGRIARWVDISCSTIILSTTTGGIIQK